MCHHCPARFHIQTVSCKDTVLLYLRSKQTLGLMKMHVSLVWTVVKSWKLIPQHGGIEGLVLVVMFTLFLGGWRNSLVVKSIGCSSREPRFKSKHQHGSQQPSVALVPGNLMLSSILCGHQAHKRCTDILAGKTAIYIK